MNLHPLSLSAMTVYAVVGWSGVVGESATVHRVAFATPSTQAPASQNTSSVPAYDTYVAELLARPLFSSTRRPDQAPRLPGSAATVAGVPRLSGILVNGADRRAIFAGAEQGGRVQSIVAREGDDVGAYRVQSVTFASVTLTGPNGAVVLKPSFTTAPSAQGPSGLQVPSSMINVGSPRLDPNRFDAPVGPMGLAMYRYDPAAPHAPTPVAPALTAR